MLPIEMLKFIDYWKKQGVAFEMYKDQVIFAKDEIVKKDGSPYKVYTPFSRKMA